MAVSEKGDGYVLDLTTLSGWSDVTDGSHTVSIKAKADGYQDSPASAGAIFTKAESETWVLNRNGIDLGSSRVTYDVSFSYNKGSSLSYATKLKLLPDVSKLIYGDTYTAWFYGWTDYYDNIITFAKPVTDTTLLAWLQANGTKQ